MRASGGSSGIVHADSGPDETAGEVCCCDVGAVGLRRYEPGERVDLCLVDGVLVEVLGDGEVAEGEAVDVGGGVSGADSGLGTCRAVDGAEAAGIGAGDFGQVAAGGDDDVELVGDGGQELGPVDEGGAVDSAVARGAGDRDVSVGVSDDP